ncbi:MAG: phospho-N-acetylmuramoyl-pentapeptide-transferase [Floccifex porci]|uniref:Phospho-N-acetylmuramoyl-pentapeptide-transferase n=1 Tax=Floccifex porci TaxID=2606629 RepID=A0A7X2N3Z7_9FIRM|nr:phospho-N-acetylmuramoyl-pentapeptide-transferase [Floccifex porci]MCI7802896.1 phospho-N-acetylmuramoyl-pentapeptide-transferase [Erysipelotrichaceae bacterium]MDD7467891.1 phospho-N-acetylmuramoyl-pentapeptide-transferase [Floccifex porci]MDY4796880.1 phospho-N-acetylmuramoyl-pentapeptide-transferase [Floccifex porci]MSS02010.1 phospho-N-acetylmuramoyl-pentapeptide-transferase [Floccifex porci]
MVYIIGFFTTLLCVILIMPKTIDFLHKIKFGQTEREEGLDSHKKKNGTPTMGGIVFILIPVIIYLITYFAGFIPMDLNAVILLLAFIGYGLIGFIDDYIIVVKKDNQGLKPKTKFLMQSILAIVFFLLYRTNSSLSLWIPIWDKTIPLGFLYFFLIFIMFTAETNAVNLTDGLDGLCAGQMIIALVPFVVFAFLQGLTQIAYILILVIAALLGYLKFNKHPAKIFMGDTGSLALGGIFAATGMVLKQEILLVLIGLVFVVETLSVIIQVTYYRKTKKRIFKMAPLHHHFEMCGWNETQVVHRFWLAGLICAIAGLLIGVI